MVTLNGEVVSVTGVCSVCLGQDMPLPGERGDAFFLDFLGFLKVCLCVFVMMKGANVVVESFHSLSVSVTSLGLLTVAVEAGESSALLIPGAGRNGSTL